MSIEQKWKKRKGNLTSGMAVLQSLFEGADNPLSEQFLRWRMWMQWSQYVGTSVGSNTLPVGYHQGRLYVWVKSSAWMHQMIFLKDTLRENINKKLGRYFVREIVFTLDRHSVPAAGVGEMKELIEKIAPSFEDQD